MAIATGPTYTIVPLSVPAELQRYAPDWSEPSIFAQTNILSGGGGGGGPTDYEPNGYGYSQSG